MIYIANQDRQYCAIGPFGSIFNDFDFAGTANVQAVRPMKKNDHGARSRRATETLATIQATNKFWQFGGTLTLTEK